MNKFRVIIHLQGLFRVVPAPDGEGVLAVAPPTRFLSTERDGQGRLNVDDGRRETRRHDFYLEWDPRRTRVDGPGNGRSEGAGPDTFPSMRAIWNVRGAHVRFRFEPASNPLRFELDELRLPQMASGERALFPDELRDAARIKDSALKAPGEFDPPELDPDEEVTRERVVGQVLIEQGTAQPGDRVHLTTRFDPDLRERSEALEEPSDLNNSTLFVLEERVSSVEVEALDLISGLRLGSVKLTTGEDRLDLFAKHICPDYILQREPERSASDSSEDSDFAWLYELSHNKQKLLAHVHERGGSRLPIPVRDGDPQAGGTAECGQVGG